MTKQMPNKRQSTVQEESEPGIVYFLRFSSVEMRVVIVFFLPITTGNFVMNTQYNILQNLLIDKQKCLGCRFPGEWGQGTWLSADTFRLSMKLLVCKAHLYYL